MILELEEYKIPRALMSRIVKVVGDACTWSDEEDEYNNDDVIAVYDRLLECLKAQQDDDPGLDGTMNDRSAYPL